jgi:hypothetical protein
MTQRIRIRGLQHRPAVAIDHNRSGWRQVFLSVSVAISAFIAVNAISAAMMLCYQAAVLAELAGRIYSVEIIDELAQRAVRRLKREGYTNVEVRVGNGYFGWPEQAPFDKIIVTAVDDDLLSLSAILLDDDYYQALQLRKRMVDGVPVLDEAILIPFKARAFLDLTDRAADGEKIDDKNIKKHRNDVFRLLRLLPGDAKIEMPEQIRSDLRRFLDVIGKTKRWTLNPSTCRCRARKGWDYCAPLMA